MTAALTRTLAVLGATGSVGRQALEVAEEHGLSVTLLTANRSYEEMETLARRFLPRAVAMADLTAAEMLKSRLSDTKISVYAGEEGITQAILAVRDETDTYVNAILGMAGLSPTLAVVETGRRLALANKESLVIAGSYVLSRARESGCEIIPVDSEHSAIFQALRAGEGKEVRRLILTASGGPFRHYTEEMLSSVTREDALRHPTWQMGQKITIDSATMMNKGFEVIEAAHLFGISPKDILVVVHPESMIHSAVEYIDGTTIAEMSVPDMRSCVRYALFHPHRVEASTQPLDWYAMGSLTFERPNMEAFPLLALAGKCFEMGGGMPAVLNAANEVAVEAFLQGEISFLAISQVVTQVVGALSSYKEGDSLSHLFAADAAARALATAYCKEQGNN